MSDIFVYGDTPVKRRSALVPDQNSVQDYTGLRLGWPRCEIGPGGLLLLNSSHKMTPNEYTSQGGQSQSLLSPTPNVSGEAYCTVPFIVWVVTVSRKSLAVPKSVTLARPSSLTTMLTLLRSRCASASGLSEWQ